MLASLARRSFPGSADRPIRKAINGMARVREAISDLMAGCANLFGGSLRTFCPLAEPFLLHRFAHKCPDSR